MTQLRLIHATAWVLVFSSLSAAAEDRLVFEAKVPNGQRIVLIAGDEEYRSEESLPMLGKILSQRHGFQCTVLFSFGPDDADYIDANHQAGLRGLDALNEADLMIIATRFRRPGEQQAAHITNFLNAGKPIIGLRTATHAFAGDERFGGTLPYEEFGLKILGEEWVSHHGKHKSQGTRSLPEPSHGNHPILRSVNSFFAPSDVYGVTHLTASDKILLRGAVTESLDPASAPVKGDANDPMQPLAWLHDYESPDGKANGLSFCTTAGAAVDFVDANLRRLIVNAAYFLTGQAVPRSANVDFVDPFYPSFYGFIRDENYWKQAHKRPADYGLGQSFAMPDPPGSPDWKHRPKAAMTFQPGERVAFVGNSLAERMNLFGHFEALLQHRFADEKLVVRNFGWPADEVALQQRPENYTKLDDPLAVFRPGCFFCFFGFNESFAASEDESEGALDTAIETFVSDYAAYLDRLESRFAGSRYVLVTPIAFEASGNPLQPNGQAENRRLEKYSQAIRELALARGCGFVDLFGPTHKHFRREERLQYTVNGVHLNEEGDLFIARLLDRSLFGEPQVPTVDLETLRLAVVDKAWHHLQDYRMLNGWYVYGGRRTWDTETFPAEFRKIRKMVAVRDQYVWDIAAGKSVPAEPDDSGTGEVVVPDTMFGTRDEGFRKFREPETLVYPTPQESMDQMTMPEGFTIKLFAAEEKFPELANPTQLNFDHRGRLWVSCMANYPQWSPAGSKPNDRLLILEDTDGNGEADKSTVFYDKLICPTGFEFWNGGVLVVDQPRIIFLKDTDGDDKADQVIHLLDGWGADDTHHACGAWEYSHAGLLYALEGIHMSTTLETPWGPFRVKGPSGAYVIDPQTWKVRYFRTPGYGNPWCMVFDQWGTGVIGDGTGSNQHWATPLSGAKVQSRRTMRTIFDNEGMRPSVGSEFLRTRQFPAELHDHFIYGCVINMHGLTRFDVRDEEEGAGFTGERIEDLLSSTDNFFRPVDPKVGPDGALWFGDWCNPLIGHMQYSQRDPNRDHDHGRVYRMIYAANPLLETVTQHDKSVEELLMQLLAFEPRTRSRARRELRDRPQPEVLTAVKKWVGDGSDPRRNLEAMWVQEGFRAVDLELLEDVLAADDFRARAAAVHTLANEVDRVAGADEMLRAAVSDEHPRVRVEAIRALSFLGTPEAAAVAMEATKLPVDYWIDYTLEHTLSALSEELGDERQFMASLDPAVMNKFEGYLMRLTPGGDVMAPLKVLGDGDSSPEAIEKAVRTLVGHHGGDAGRGKVIYERVCSSCHLIHGKGKDFGPDLSNVARRLSKEEIIRSVMLPNETIAKGYETLLVETDEGKTFSGLLMEETEELLTMRIAEGEVVAIPKSSIEEREQKNASSMPEGLIKTIAAIEYLDLIHYLEAQNQSPDYPLRDDWLAAKEDSTELRKNGEFVEVSRHAELQLEPCFPSRYNRHANWLLSTIDSAEQDHPGFVFHSPDRNVNSPFVVIRLPEVTATRFVEIQNRVDKAYWDRADTLTMWVSTDGEAWQQVWQENEIAEEWAFELPAETRAKYVKLGLTKQGILHLNRVVIYGEPSVD
jgi:putative heme-binding domain-containing protein